MSRSPYQHLNATERAMIRLLDEENHSVREIARRVGRSPATVSRERHRGRDDDQQRYCPSIGARVYQQRRLRSRRHRKLQAGSALHETVRRHLLYRLWSPEQIAGRLRRMHPDSPEKHVSHETIYAAIYAHPKGALRQEMIEMLRQQRSQRGPRRRRTPAGRAMVPEDLCIRHRPEEIEERLAPGHWEGDFIKGAFNRSAVGTLVERKTRYVVLCRMKGCDASSALESFTRQMRHMPACVRETMTYDRGSEMARHEELARRLNMTIWFADPHAPWQRGSNENTNGLLRQFLPKGTDLGQVTQTQLNDIAELMNNRPRKTLDFKTPNEVMAEELNQTARECCA